MVSSKILEFENKVQWGVFWILIFLDMDPDVKPPFEILSGEFTITTYLLEHGLKCHNNKVLGISKGV